MTNRAEGPNCLTYYAPMAYSLKPYRTRRLKRDAIPGCRLCCYRRRFPSTLDNHLGKLLRERIIASGLSPGAWSRESSLSHSVVRQIIVGDRHDANGKRV